MRRRIPRRATNTPADDANDPVADRMPAANDPKDTTDAERDHAADQDQEPWADLAASARADWAAENPF